MRGRPEETWVSLLYFSKGKVMKKHNNEIKEVNSWSFSGNLITKSNFTLTLFNEDDNGNETDTVFIRLTEKELRGMIKALSSSLEGMPRKNK